MSPDACPACGRDCEGDDHVADNKDLFAMYALRVAGYRDAVGVVREMSPDTLPALADALTTLLGIVIVVARDHGQKI